MTRPFRSILPLLLVALLGSTAAPLYAHGTPPAPAAQDDLPQTPSRPWSSLDPAQREVLAPLQNEWDSMSARRQAHMLKRAEHWVTLPPEKREEVRQHIAHWQQMTPAERRQARDNRRKFNQLSPQQREQLHSTFERFQQLPSAQREKLLREWHALPPAERLHWDQRRGHDRPPQTGGPGRP